MCDVRQGCVSPGPSRTAVPGGQPFSGTTPASWQLGLQTEAQTVRRGLPLLTCLSPWRRGAVAGGGGASGGVPQNREQTGPMDQQPGIKTPGGEVETGEAAAGHWENRVRSQGACFGGDSGAIVLRAVFPVS